MKKVRLLIKRSPKGKDERITVRLDEELSQLVNEEPNVSGIIRDALKEYYSKRGPTLTAEGYWKNEVEIEIYADCCGYFASFVGPHLGEKFTAEFIPKLFPDPPPDRLLPYVHNQIVARHHDERLIQMFEENNEAWLEFYAKARAFYFYETSVPFNLLSDKHKEEYTKYILKR